MEHPPFYMVQRPEDTALWWGSPSFKADNAGNVQAFSYHPDDLNKLQQLTPLIQRNGHFVAKTPFSLAVYFPF